MGKFSAFKVFAAIMLAASISWGQGNGSVENPWQIGGPNADVTATLTGDENNRTLTISGTGAMMNYPDASDRPWHDDREYITSVVIEEGVTRIGDWAFAECENLTSVTIPESVTEIEGGAFYHCYSLTSVTIPNSVKTIGESAFATCIGLISLTIGNSVETIGDMAFRNCRNLTEVTIPNSVKIIGNSAFSGCTGLTSLTIGNSVQTIGDRAFRECENLTEVTIPNSVKTIGNSAFVFCTGLTSVTIGNSVTSIEDWAFGGCTALTEVISLNPTPITNLNANVFSNDFGESIAGQMTLKVPGASITAYENAPVWGTFQRVIGLFDVAELSISGPRKNKTHAEITATAAHERVNIASITWNANHDPFQVSTVYTATVVLEVDGVNAIFTDNVTATVNVHEATVTERSAKSITLTYTFPATEDREITSIFDSFRSD